MNNRRIGHLPIKLTLHIGLFVWLSLLGSAHQASANMSDAKEALEKNHVVAVMRHAIAPGNGDPMEFELGDCETQRNLSAEGVLQAQRIGRQLKELNVAQADVFSSQWCRCIDTANQLDLGPVQALPMLNSFYQDRSTADAQTEQLQAWILNRLTTGAPSSKPTEPNAVLAVLVTHQVNITALTGVYPSSGEIVFVTEKNGQLIVAPGNPE